MGASNRDNAGRMSSAFMTFDVFIDDVRLNESMPGHCMAQCVVIAKPE
jgi:hypothetical protein